MRAQRDVVVVGAGPAGATAAALLAERGHDVLVLEKEHFPRAHIGESLLPACLPVLERLGVAPTSDTFLFKGGAVFACEQSGRSQRFGFEEALPDSPRHAWHVERPLFDTRLRDTARARGAEIRHGESVLDAGVDARGAWVRTATEEVTARFLIDATGQRRLLGRRRDSVRAHEGFGRAAVFTHFEGLSPSASEELAPGFDIRILLRDEGWGWVIPLPAGRLSVGLVGKHRVTPDHLEHGLLTGPFLERLTRGARRLTTHTVGNYSYTSTEPFGARFAAVGDAACFLDPVFSSGVTLALRGAASVADRLSTALGEGAEGAPDLLHEHALSHDRAVRTFAALISRFYEGRFLRSLFLSDSLGFEQRRGVLSVLAGDVWRTDNPFQDLLLDTRRAARYAALSRSDSSERP